MRISKVSAYLAIFRWSPEDGRGRTPAGFTLLELVLAVTLLATFILPMIHLIAESRVRAIRYTIERQVRNLAQQKLHDRIHYYETEDAGTFEEEGKPRWSWEIDPPEMRTQSEQVILTYTIRVTIPQRLSDTGGAGRGEGEGGSTYEYSVWAFPDERWYEEQDYLYQQGHYSLLYGYPEGSAGLPGVR